MDNEFYDDEPDDYSPPTPDLEPRILALEKFVSILITIIIISLFR